MHVEVAVVGAGFAGISAAIALRADGREVVIFDRGSSAGGTWRDNVYPGVRCDVPAHLYALRTHPNARWSAEFARGAEIHDYLESVARDEHLDIRLGAELASARWDGRWHLTFTDGARATATILLLACGRLSEPRIPALPGLADFHGPVQHTARWSTELDGKHVAVIGTGASAIQLVPALVRRGSRVTLFQRSAPWVLPRGGSDYTDGDRARWSRNSTEMTVVREALRADGERRFPSRSGDPSAAGQARRVALAHLRAQVSDASLRAALTPTDEFGCKRVLLSDDFYPAVAGEQVVLEPAEAVRVTGDAVVSARGVTHDGLDAIVFATGFHATTPPIALRVHGEHGVALSAHWSTGMTAYAGVAMAGFPDLFVVGGPNSALTYTSSVLMIEAQVDYVRSALTMREASGVPLRVRADAEIAYTREVDRRAQGRVWLGSCDNWYVDARSGRLTVAWPGTVDEYVAGLGEVGAEFEQVAAGVGG